jgi:hypothetical protein
MKKKPRRLKKPLQIFITTKNGITYEISKELIKAS